jgi:anti-sigma B factor antagonist
MDTSEDAAGRVGRHASPVRSDLSLTADGTGATQRTAGALAVGVLASNGHDQDAAVLCLHGELDLGTAPQLREVMQPVLERQTGPVVLDLSEVSFMDSTGVHLLLETLQRLKLQNRRLAIACCESGQVHRLLALVGLLDALSVYRSRESAVIGGDDLLRSELGTNT